MLVIIACMHVEKQEDGQKYVFFINSKTAVCFLTHIDGKSSPGGKRKKGDDREVRS